MGRRDVDDYASPDTGLNFFSLQSRAVGAGEVYREILFSPVVVFAAVISSNGRLIAGYSDSRQSFTPTH